MLSHTWLIDTKRTVSRRGTGSLIMIDVWKVSGLTSTCRSSLAATRADAPVFVLSFSAS